jgi:putative toxin-antitoxin system antitoxin component (TIGR02293 family)
MSKLLYSDETSMRPSDLLQADSSVVITALRNGALTGTYIPDLARRLGVSTDFLVSSLRLPKSTIAKRIASNSPLAPAEQDRIYRAERAFARAREVFGDGNAQRWMAGPVRTLGGVSPLTLLDTQPGYEMVIATLGRIEYGVFG